MRIRARSSDMAARVLVLLSTQGRCQNNTLVKKDCSAEQNKSLVNAE